MSPLESPHNYRGIAGETSFGIGPHNTFGIVGGERLLESPHQHQRSFSGCWNKLLGSLDVITFRAVGISFWGRWTSSSRLGVRGNITSGVAEQHRRLRADGHYFWGRCTIFISISRRTSASSGVAPAFRQHLFCSSTTRLLCSCCSHVNSSIATMQSVVTGQAPITLERKRTSGGKQTKTEDNTHNNCNFFVGGGGRNVVGCYVGFSILGQQTDRCNIAHS